MRVVLRLEDGDAVGRGAFERIEHLPPRRSFGVFVNLVWLGIWKGLCSDMMEYRHDRKAVQ